MVILSTSALAVIIQALVVDWNHFRPVEVRQPPVRRPGRAAAGAGAHRVRELLVRSPPRASGGAEPACWRARRRP